MLMHLTIRVVKRVKILLSILCDWAFTILFNDFYDKCRIVAAAPLREKNCCNEFMSLFLPHRLVLTSDGGNLSSCSEMLNFENNKEHLYSPIQCMNIALKNSIFSRVVTCPWGEFTISFSLKISFTRD